MAVSLSKYYRQPKAYIELPTKGSMYELEDKEQSILSEVGVMPMTMFNELTVNNPEALINGSAVEELIRDCTNIKSIEPRKLFKCDIDALVMAIRMVSVGEEIEVTMKCPECEKESTYAIDLQHCLSQITFHEEMPYEVELEDIEGITLRVVPSTLESALRIDQTFFQDAKEIDHLRNLMKRASSAVSEQGDIEPDDINNEVMKYVHQIYDIQHNMTVNTVRLYADSVYEVVTPEGVVDDREEITEFVMNLSKDDHKKLKDKIRDINQIGVPKTQDFTCQECNHQYTGPFEMNPTDFFGNGSR